MNVREEALMIVPKPRSKILDQSTKEVKHAVRSESFRKEKSMSQAAIEGGERGWGTMDELTVIRQPSWGMKGRSNSLLGMLGAHSEAMRQLVLAGLPTTRTCQDQTPVNHPRSMGMCAARCYVVQMKSREVSVEKTHLFEGICITGFVTGPNMKKRARKKSMHYAAPRFHYVLQQSYNVMLTKNARAILGVVSKACDA